MQPGIKASVRYSPTNNFTQEASAIVKIINDKIVQIQLLNGGDEYIEIPEINFVMNAPVLSKKYYQVWKQMTVNNVLQDEMLQVMEYFETIKNMLLLVLLMKKQEIHFIGIYNGIKKVLDI